MVQFGSRLPKKYKMDSVYIIRHMDNKFKGIIVSHDLTKSQWGTQKKLIQEAKTNMEQDLMGEWVYCVRGSPEQLKIARFKKNC